MSFAGILISVLLFVFAISVMILKHTNSSPSNSHDFQFTLNPPIVFLVFNIIIVAIIVGSSWPSVEEVDSNYTLIYPSPDQLEECPNDNARYNSFETCSSSDSEDDDSENNEPYYDSDGYDGDDENLGCTCQDLDYEQDGYLEKRIEEFIDKVNKGWREERD